MNTFWVGFVTGLWIGPAAVVLCLFFYAHLTRWKRPTSPHRNTH